MSGHRALSRWVVLATWGAAMMLCLAYIARIPFTADLSAFLPSAPTKEQRILLDQLQNGVVSRLILVGIDGGDAVTRAALSKRLAAKLRPNPAMASVANGEPVSSQADQQYLFSNRYLLSEGVTADRYTKDGLRVAVSDTIGLLASPAGLLAKGLLPQDPTGEMMVLLSHLQADRMPSVVEGVWGSPAHHRALLLVQTAASGADTDAQERAIADIRAAFAGAKEQHGAGAEAASLVLTGPGVFAVNARNAIEREALRMSVLATAIIVILLSAVYRSVIAVALGMLPVVTGALAGVVAVGAGFGVVHGVTLGFGVTLIGETVDYAIYLFIQSRRSHLDARSAAAEWIRECWPTVRIGVMTSIAGFACLLPSSFPGLSQLGLYSIAGLVAAAVFTRFGLPHLLPDQFRARDLTRFGSAVGTLARAATAWRMPLMVLVGAAGLFLYAERNTLWNAELSALSPVSQQEQELDAALRADMGAPDVRYMVVVNGLDEEAALIAAEKAASRLQALVDDGVLAGFESPARYLPSRQTQRLRQQSIDAAGLEERLAGATSGLGIRRGALDPFIAEATASASRSLLTRSDLTGTSFAMAVDSLLFQSAGRWNAVLPLSLAPDSSGAADVAATRIRQAIDNAPGVTATFVDLKAESDHLYDSYLDEAVTMSMGGLAGIIVLLLASLRSIAAACRVVLPLVAAVVGTTAILVLAGQQLNILHLVGLLLIVAVGSNYALFFGRTQNRNGVTQQADPSPGTYASLVLANITTVTGFGLLAFSGIPVLTAIGSTVGLGAVLALACAAILAPGAAPSTQAKA